MALHWGVKNLWHCVYLCRTLWGEGLAPPLIVLDSKAVYDQLRSGTAASEPKLGPALKYIVQELEDLEAQVMWSPRKNQIADSLTKAIWPKAPASVSLGKALQEYRSDSTHAAAMKALREKNKAEKLASKKK